MYEPRQIDWNITGPAIEGCVEDLKELQSLNDKTDALTAQLKRIILQKVQDIDDEGK